MPKFSRSNWVSSSTSRNGGFGPPGSGGAGGTTWVTRPMAASARIAVSHKMPPMPIAAYSAGAATSEMANTSPIEEPIIAMTLVRCCSRVRSAASAVTAAEIAPAPCRTRPRMVHQMSVARAATAEPKANSSKPVMMTRLRP